MKVLSYRQGDSESFGLLLEGRRVLDGKSLLGAKYPTLMALLQADALDLLRRADPGKASTYALDEVELLQPIGNPSRILCVGLNYRSHIEETGMETPRYPTIFTRYPDSLVASGEPIVVPRVSSKLDFEGELAVVIGRQARHVPAANALDYVAGYSCLNDGSVRDFQRHGSQFTPGKNFYHSGAMGPWLVTADELGNGSGLMLETRLNGEVMQHGNTDDLLFGVADLIAYLSQVMPLQPGDIISTGTPGGVGFVRDPRVFLKPGDLIEVEIAGIGVLANPVQAES